MERHERGTCQGERLELEGMLKGIQDMHAIRCQQRQNKPVGDSPGPMRAG